MTVYLSSLSKGSRRTANQSLRVITEVSGRGDDILNYPWHELRYQHVQAIRTYLADKYSVATANKILAILKGVLKECKRLGLMSIEDYDKAVDIKAVSGNTITKGKYITPEQFKAILDSCDNTLIGKRNRAIFHCLQLGLRRSEVASLNVKDFNYNEGSILVTKAKRNKSRLVFLTDAGIKAIKDYLEERRKKKDGRSNDNNDSTTSAFFPLSSATSLENWLFSSGRNQRITDQTIYNIIKSCAATLDINIAAHDFRRTCASNLLSKGVDIVTVKNILGHESIETTANYDRRGIDAQKQASKLLD